MQQSRATGFTAVGSFPSPDNGITLPIKLDQSFPPIAIDPKAITQAKNISTNVIERNSRGSQIHQWNLNIERQFGDFLVQLAYAGSKGTHLIAASYNINQVPTALLGPGNAQSRRPFPDFQNITAPEPNMTYEQIWPDLISVFRELGDHADKYKLRLGIETGSPNTVKQYLALIRDIAHDFVGGTVDTGHTRVYRADIGIDDSERATPKGARRYNDVLMEKVEGPGPKLFHFHLDDVRPADWREHRTVGSGLVNWPRLLRYLSKVGHQRTFAIELEETPTVDELAKSQAFFEKILREIA